MTLRCTDRIPPGENLEKFDMSHLTEAGPNTDSQYMLVTGSVVS